MDLVERARRLAERAYADPTELGHPDEVARLIEQAGYPREVIAAALLHDVIEDTGVDQATIEAELGPEVAALVACMTEDGSIPDYADRKAEARARASAGGEACAAIYVADKLSNARRMRMGQKQPDDRKLAHYVATLELMRREHPELPLLNGLARELGASNA